MQQIVRTPTDRGLITVTFTDEQTQNEIVDHTIVQIGDTVTPVSRNIAPDSIHPASAKIWRFYRAVHEGNFTPRIGYEACGCNGDILLDIKAPRDYRRIESATEHASGCVALLEGLNQHHQLLAPDDYERTRQLLTLHDLGENLYGDHFDDGSQDSAEKNKVELSYFASAISSLPPAARAERLQDFLYFQDPTDSHIPESARPRIQLATIIDKLEATLSSLIYEAHGAGGRLSYKKAYCGRLTSRDYWSIDEADGDDSIVATWLIPVIFYKHDYYGFPYVFDVVKTAVIDVRGAWFPWFDQFCKRHQIPPEHINYPSQFDDQQTFDKLFHSDFF